MPTATPVPTQVPTATPIPTPTPDPELSPSEVYSLVSPSIPFIETAAATGSGVLIEGGYVVTNYHVVWPYEAVWVVFPDGTELANVPVAGWDPMADLAVLGPVDVSAQPLKLTDAEDTDLGAELLLVGYPAEVDLFPQPSITRGILSRFREWERLSMTYFQTDAAIAGGQSGGALLNSKGEVIGISGLSFSDAGFGLAASSADIAPIVEKLIRGEFTSGLGDRRIPGSDGSFEFDLDLENFWDARTFVLDAAAGTILEVGIEGPGDGLFHVSGPFGLLLEVGDSLSGVEYGEVELILDGIHFLQVEMAAGESSEFKLAGNASMRPLNDPDDGQILTVGETVAGSLDFFYDWDWYSILLEEGETVKISTDSLNVDTFIYVDFPGSRDDQIVFDDDSGAGLYGTDSELVYRAPVTGKFFIVVTDAVNSYTGGYYLSVEPAREGTETVHVPTGPEAVGSPFVGMKVFEDPDGLFEVQVPDNWAEEGPDSSTGQIFGASDSEGRYVVIYVEDRDYASLEDHAEILESVLLERGATNVNSQRMQTANGLPVVAFEFEFGPPVEDTASGWVWIIHLSDAGTSFEIAYGFDLEQFEEGKELAYYSLSTFRVN